MLKKYKKGISISYIYLLLTCWIPVWERRASNSLPDKPVNSPFSIATLWIPCACLTFHPFPVQHTILESITCTLYLYVLYISKSSHENLSVNDVKVSPFIKMWNFKIQSVDVIWHRPTDGRWVLLPLLGDIL